MTGARTPGRVSRCYHCDNVTMIGRLAPLTQGACAKAQGRAQASVTPWVALGEATAHTLPRKDVGEATRREPPRAMWGFIGIIFEQGFCGGVLSGVLVLLPALGGRHGCAGRELCERLKHLWQYPLDTLLLSRAADVVP